MSGRARQTDAFRANRRGAVLISVMVALALITALSVAWLRIAAGERRLLREQQQRLEAGCLADSALARAAARLAADPNYRGETWHVVAESLGGRSAASVAIEIAPDDARLDARRSARGGQLSRQRARPRAAQQTTNPRLVESR